MSQLSTQINFEKLTIEQLVQIIAAASAELTKRQSLGASSSSLGASVTAVQLAKSVELSSPPPLAKKSGSAVPGVRPPQLMKASAWVDYVLDDMRLHGWEEFVCLSGYRPKDCSEVKRSETVWPASIMHEDAWVFDGSINASTPLGTQPNLQHAMSVSKIYWSVKDNSGSKPELYQEFEAAFSQQYGEQSLISNKIVQVERPIRKTFAQLEQEKREKKEEADRVKAEKKAEKEALKAEKERIKALEKAAKDAAKLVKFAPARVLAAPVRILAAPASAPSRILAAPVRISNRSSAPLFSSLPVIEGAISYLDDEYMISEVDGEAIYVSVTTNIAYKDDHTRIGTLDLETGELERDE
jgi:hypothetical protein